MDSRPGNPLRFVVEPVMFFTFMSMNMEISLVQQLIRTKVCWLDFSDKVDCSSTNLKNVTRLTADSSKYIMGYDATLSMFTMVVGVWFGSWADKFGRKRMMIVPTAFSIVSTINFIWQSSKIRADPSFVLLSAFLIGLSTGTLGTCATCFGLVSETTSVRWRSTRMASMEAAMFLGGSVGFYVVGFMKPRYGFVPVFCLELAIHLATLCYIVFVVRDPIQTTQRSGVPSMPVLSVRHLHSMLRTVKRQRQRNHRLVLGLLLASSLALAYGLAATSYLTFSFLHAAPFDFSGSSYSFYHGGLVAVQGISIVAVMPLCLACFGMKDATAGFLGALSRCLGLFWLSASSVDWMVYATLAVLSFSEFALPSIRSLVSKIVDSNEKSQIFACMSLLQSFAFFTGSFLFVGTFKAASEHLWTGFGFMVAGCLQLVPVSVFVYLYFFLEMESLQAPFHGGHEEITDEALPESQSEAA